MNPISISKIELHKGIIFVLVNLPHESELEGYVCRKYCLQPWKIYVVINILFPTYCVPQQSQYAPRDLKTMNQ